MQTIALDLEKPFGWLEKFAATAASGTSNAATATIIMTSDADVRNGSFMEAKPSGGGYTFHSLTLGGGIG